MILFLSKLASFKSIVKYLVQGDREKQEVSQRSIMQLLLC